MMFKLTIEHVGHGLEAAVRMIRRTKRLTGLIVNGTHLIDHQDRIDQTYATRGRQWTADLETTAFKLRLRCTHLLDFPQHGPPPVEIHIWITPV
jgi:hypothetical protein